VYQNSDFSSVWKGAAIGAIRGAYGAWQESARNNAEEGHYGTDDGTFKYLVKQSNEGSAGINATKAQRALDYFSRRNGVPGAEYIAPVKPDTSPYTDMEGNMFITEHTFSYGAGAVKAALVHELGHYIYDVDWADKTHSHFRPRSNMYDLDGPSGYNYAIRHAGRFHLSYNAIASSNYEGMEGPASFFGPDAWKAYNFTKWVRLFPWR
jgi:hypothetical protein